MSEGEMGEIQSCGCRWERGPRSIETGLHKDNLPCAGLTLTDYQRGAATTAQYPDAAKLVYPVLGLASEAGELAGKLKKVIRDADGVLSASRREDMADELGDVLWYVAIVARDLDFTLDAIGRRNLAKLKDRHGRGVIKGSGDKR